MEDMERMEETMVITEAELDEEEESGAGLKIIGGAVALGAIVTGAIIIKKKKLLSKLPWHKKQEEPCEEVEEESEN